jgi:hypothetical protein
MDILVLLEECDDEAGRVDAPAGASAARPLAYVHSAPDPRAWSGAFDARGPASGREVVMLCGAVDSARLAVALAAVLEARLVAAGPETAVRHLGVWDGAGASGDSAWRDSASGQLMSQDIAIPAATLEATARELLRDAGRVIQQTAAELVTADWPEGARRAISFTLPTVAGRWPRHAGRAETLGDDALLALLREADDAAGADGDGEPGAVGDGAVQSPGARRPRRDRPRRRGGGRHGPHTRRAGALAPALRVCG